MKPIIGIVSNFELEKDGYFCFAHYVRAVEDAGGVPVILPYADTASVQSILGLLSGVLLSGGGDFPAELYGEKPHPTFQKMVPERDRFEFALAEAALKAEMPVLGICRGMQVLNVIEGGTIYPHTLDALPQVADHRDGSPLDAMVHRIDIEPASRLAQLLGTGEMKLDVNSMHHQAINKLAHGYDVSARSEDGLIEAIEARDRPFVIGVQWHPEWMFDKNPACRSLFRNFIKACVPQA